METGGEVEKVMCFCGEDREFGEMACCELHATGWYHFRCMRLKKNMDLLAKRISCAASVLHPRLVSFARGRDAEE